MPQKFFRHPLGDFRHPLKISLPPPGRNPETAPGREGEGEVGREGEGEGEVGREGANIRFFF